MKHDEADRCTSTTQQSAAATEHSLEFCTTLWIVLAEFVCPCIKKGHVDIISCICTLRGKDFMS